MAQKIIWPNFLTLAGNSFGFCMTDHLDPLQSQNTILTDVCQTISAGFVPRFPNYARLLGGNRILLILPRHWLFQYLDRQSQNEIANFLIFNMQGNSVTVTHFGPFGKAKENDFKEKIRNTEKSLKDLKKRWWYAVKSKPVGKRKREKAKIIEELRNNYWAKVQEIESQIASKKEEFKELTLRVFEDEKETVKDLLEKLMASTEKVMIKAITDKIAKKVSVKLTAKTAAKIAAKSGAKAAGKAAAKAVPVVGAVVGLGFGIWRLTQGDVTGAGMEVFSGAASCVPGGGTAASLGVDAAIVARDVYLATEEIKRLAKVIFEKRQLSLLTGS